MAGLRAIELMSGEMSRFSKTFDNDAGGSIDDEMNRNQSRRAMNVAFSGRDTIQSLKVTASKTCRLPSTLTLSLSCSLGSKVTAPLV